MPVIFDFGALGQVKAYPFENLNDSLPNRRQRMDSPNFGMGCR